MKNDVKNEVPNGTPETLILSNGVLNRDGVSKQVVDHRGTMLDIFEVG